eukprot:132432_1
MSLIERIDKALHLYYKHYQRSDYISSENNNGKFQIFCEENGFEDDDVETELQALPDECMLVEFDDTFPLLRSIINPKEKISKIHEILNYCKQNGKPPSYAPTLFDMMDMDVDSKQIEQTKNIYKECCHDLEKHIKNEDFWYLATVGKINNIPLLVWLSDAYGRDRVKCYLKYGKTITIYEWVTQSPMTATATQYHKKIVNSLQEYFKRYNNKITFNPMRKLNVTFSEFCNPVLAMIAFVKELVENKSVTPFQFDLMLIPPVPIDNADDTDDCSDDDDDEQQTDDKIGNVCKRLNT